MTEPTKEEVEHLALRIYDQMNPDSERIINMGKSDCIKEARRRLRLRARARGRKRAHAADLQQHGKK
jgi:hypothetical protein